MVDMISPPWLPKLRGVQRTKTGWVAFCPAHDDQEKRSLSVTAKSDRWLVHCFVGCVAPAIMRALSLDVKALFFAPAAERRTEWRIVATYDYTDAAGVLLYQVVRYTPKDFKHRRPDGGGGWVWNINDVAHVLYRLPELAEVERVTWVEGEADVETLRARGIVATTSCTGANSWRDEYADDLARLGVQELVVLPDHDEPGEQYAAAVAGACRARGLRVKIVRLPGLPTKGDVSDWFRAGHTDEEYQRVVDEVPWAEAAPVAPGGRVHLGTILDAVLADLEAGRHEVVGTGLPTLDALLGGGFEAGNLIYLGGRPSSGKTALALQWSREAASQGHSVLVVSLEMALLALGRRVLAQAAGVDALALKTGRIGDGDWYAIRAVLPKLRTLPMWFADQAMTVEAIEALVSGFAEHPPLGLLVVDYLQLVEAPGKLDDRQQVESVSKGLKRLAKAARIPVLCASSLSRAPQGQRERRPALADLRQSGELEHDADIVVFLHGEALSSERELILAKNRDGPTGTMTLRFLGTTLRLQEVAQRKENDGG